MIGGVVIEVADVPNRPDVVFVDVAERNRPSQTCAIFVERTPDSVRIEIGDTLWWQGSYAYWTPQANRYLPKGQSRCGVTYEIKIPRRGYSGVEHPSRAKTEEA